MISSALREGVYSDVVRWAARRNLREPEPTYVRSCNRFDYFLLRRSAVAAFSTGGNVNYDHGFPTHTPAFVDLQLFSFRQKCLLRQSPVLISKGCVQQQIAVTDDLQQQIKLLHQHQWVDSLQSNNVEAAEQIWCSRAEHFLLQEAGVPKHLWKRHSGRGETRRPRQGYICKRSCDNLAGADFADAK